MPASLGALTPLAHLEPKIFQELLEVNVTANWRLIRSLDPLLRQSDAGRALFVTSGAARKHTPFWGGYAMTKAALESLALTYAAECATTKVKVNLLSPGPMRTVMRAKAMPGEDPADAAARRKRSAPLIVELLSPSCTKNGELVKFQVFAGTQQFAQRRSDALRLIGAHPLERRFADARVS